MRILLAQNSRYYPAHGGGDKSNRLLMEALAARGHQCLVVARLSRFGPREHDLFLSELAARNVPAKSSDGVVVFERSAVAVHTATNHPSLRAYLVALIGGFKPEIIVASTDDPAQFLLEPALAAEGARLVYLARATLALPFGPDSAFPSEAKTNLLRRAGAVVGVSQYVADYIRRWSGIEAVHVPISLVEQGPYEALGRFENEFVTLVNPCAVKGISIFLALAEAMPSVRFAAVPLWGTNEADRRALDEHPNISILPAVDEVSRLLARTRVLLVPSLWAEARSRIVLEAMLHGVPVIASDVGGIAEAKLGVDYLVPVRPIVKYQERVDDQMVPVAEVPAQEIGPWSEALARLISDREHYAQLSQASRAAALRYVAQLSVAPFEQLLEETLRKPRAARAAAAGEPAADPLARLSPEKRRLLALRLRAKTAGLWFQPVKGSAEARLRLFCFPYAGGGAGAFRGWAGHLPAGLTLDPARLPGRETRLAEPPFDAMEPLIEALSEAIAPHLDKPFAFFGHSMGAAIAFELARSLRRRGLPQPACLFVSAARAPQLRRGPLPPAPSDDELLRELRRLDGVPEELLENEEWTRLALPTLRSDAALYRNYIYAEGPPLNCPVRAYGGLEDERVTRAHLDAWAAQTIRSFALQMLPGGHFFLRTHAVEFLQALSRDLERIISPG